jgi:ornithine cyclodeaminase/alanine dehydrogenase-like protein (mu-crystallin family)
MRVLVLSDADVRRVLEPEACERAMAEILAARARGEAFNSLRTMMMAPGAAGIMGLMPAHGAGGGDSAGAGVFALKSICVMPGNPARGLDAHQGTVTLFDGDTGRPTAILNASSVTEIRTAAVTAVATRLLARADARVLAVLGAGVQGRSHLRALHGVRDWAEVRVFAPTVGHVHSVVDGSPIGGTIAAPSAREAVEGADVVVAATTSRVPVLERGWLAPGAHVNAVGASQPAAWELDVATVADGALFCDSRESVLAEAGEFLQAVKEGAIAGEDHIRAELGEVLAGLRPGRPDPGELTVFRSLGIAVEDLAAAQLTVERARAAGLGVEVEL